MRTTVVLWLTSLCAALRYVDLWAGGDSAGVCYGFQLDISGLGCRCACVAGCAGLGRGACRAIDSASARGVGSKTGRVRL